MQRLLLLLLFVFIQLNIVLAGPGGNIAKDFFKGPIGKFIAIPLVIIFLPWIFLSMYRTKKAASAVRRRLSEMAKVHPVLFDEISLKNRMTDVFTRVHKAWSERNLDDCEGYMTEWFRQNQQIVYLDDWERRGMRNICSIRNINKIKPIHLRIVESEDFNGSRIVYAIEANMEDYLAKIKDSSVIEGKKGFRDIETVWTLMLEGKTWKVDNIEQDDKVDDYTKMEKSMH